MITSGNVMFMMMTFGNRSFNKLSLPLLLNSVGLLLTVIIIVVIYWLLLMILCYFNCYWLNL